MTTNQPSRRSLALAIPFLLLLLALLASGSTPTGAVAAPQAQEIDWTNCTDLYTEILPPGYDNKYSLHYYYGGQDEFVLVSMQRQPSDQAAQDFVGGPAASNPANCRLSTTYGDVPGSICEFPPDPSKNANNQDFAEINFSRDRMAVYLQASKFSLKSKAEELASAIDRNMVAAIARGCPAQAEPTATATATEVTVEAGLDLTVDHIEVVQVIQTADNKIPLVAGKKTVARVFVKATGPAGTLPTGVNASLYVWPEGKAETEVKGGAYNGPIVATVNTAPDRNRTDNSLNFVLHDELTAPGQFTVKAVVNPDRSVPESNYYNNDGTTGEPLEFVQRNGLKVGYLQVGYQPPGQATMQWPNASDIAGYDTLMKEIYPAAAKDIDYYQLYWRIRTTRDLRTYDAIFDLNWTLREYYLRMKGDKPDLIIGWIPSAYRQFFGTGGMAEVVVSGEVARAAVTVDDPAAFMSHGATTYSQGDVLAAHELGHDLGLQHPGVNGDPKPPCDIAPNGSATYWPGEYNNSATDHEVGFDTANMEVVTDRSYDIMSYCDVENWISPFHYNKLFDNNLRPQGAYTTGATHKWWTRFWQEGSKAGLEIIRPPDDYDASPSLTLPGTAAAGRYFPMLASQVFSPLDGPARAAAVMEGEGDYCLNFADAGGATLYERCFDMTFRSSDNQEPLQRQGGILEVPAQGSSFAQASFTHQGRPLVTRKAGGHSPSVTITSPGQGERWEGERTIRWTGSDAGGDEVSYDVLYSPDNKQSWYPLQVNSHDTEYTFSTDEILPGEQTYIRVLANDGFETSQADAGPIVVPRQASSPVLQTGSGEPGSTEIGPVGGSSDSTAPGASESSFNIGWLLVGVAALAAVALVVLLLVVLRSRRKQPAAYPAAQGHDQAYSYPYAYPPAPPAPPVQPQPVAPVLPPPLPPAAERFRWAEGEYWRLRNDLAAGRMAPQQFDQAVRGLTVLDNYGLYWTIGPSDGLWYVYNGREWVQAVPGSQGQGVPAGTPG